MTVRLTRLSAGETGGPRPWRGRGPRAMERQGTPGRGEAWDERPWLTAL